jgi:hypothetical protein
MEFIPATGQRYPFEDFSSRGLEASKLLRQDTAGLRARLSSAESFFERLLKKPGAAEEHARIRAILEAIRFVALTGQDEALGAYLKHVDAHAPPFVVASFDTLSEAEAWLKKHPHPPDPARILIADRSHDVFYDRETNIRRLPWNRDLQNYLAELKRVDPPIAVASFATREEAAAWLREQPEPAMRQWVSIAGEFYLAAHYPNIDHRALFPLSMAEGRDLKGDS